MSERPPLSEAHRRRLRAAYYLILDYAEQKQRAAQPQDTRQNRPLTDRLF